MQKGKRPGVLCRADNTMTKYCGRWRFVKEATGIQRKKCGSVCEVRERRLVREGDFDLRCEGWPAHKYPTHPGVRVLQSREQKIQGDSHREGRSRLISRGSPHPCPNPPCFQVGEPRTLNQKYFKTCTSSCFRFSYSTEFLEFEASNTRVGGVGWGGSDNIRITISNCY